MMSNLHFIIFNTMTMYIILEAGYLLSYQVLNVTPLFVSSCINLETQYNVIRAVINIIYIYIY